MSDTITGGTTPVVDTSTPVAGDAAAEQVVDTSGKASAPAKAPAAPKAAASAQSKKKFQVKVDGREEEVELDLSNEEELKRHIQMSRAAQKRMQQFTEYEKGVKGLFETLQTDPLKVLTDPRLKIPDAVRKKMAEAIINNEIEELQKTPEQRERDKLRKEYEDLKKQHEEEKIARERAEFARLQEQAATKYDQDISSAIDSAGLPKTARTVKYMAEALQFCLQNGLDLTPQELAPFIKKQTLGDFRDIIASLPDEEFEDWLGKDQIGRLRKRNLAKIKKVSQDPSKTPSTVDANKSKAVDKREKIPMRDFFKKLGQ